MKTRTSLLLLGLAAFTAGLVSSVLDVFPEAGANVTNVQLEECRRAMNGRAAGNRFCEEIVDSGVYDIVIAPEAAEVANTWKIALTFYGYDELVIDEQKAIYCWLTSTNTGTGVAGWHASAPTSATVTNTHGALQLVDEGTFRSFWVFSNTSNGKASLTVAQTANVAAYYLACRKDNGDVEVSSAFDFN